MLTHYDLSLPMVLAAVASSFGIEAVISHIFPDGSEEAIAHISCALTPAERNCVTKLHKYVHMADDLHSQQTTIHCCPNLAKQREFYCILRIFFNGCALTLMEHHSEIK
ncbi:unnamed protein product [Hymenolepis diminuta]|uniref:RT_RNaseH_2 domain-containing protein n=1 Tax=Hymenolepis diminuta TaxID=6216 RepID=A0A0R3SWX7_HYMDI|nr:unnamed protein product [Hymenolepis diminuta]